MQEHEVSDDNDDLAAHVESTSQAIIAGGSHADETAAAFEVFYRTHTARLVGLLIWQGAEGHLAADLTQDAMRKAWERWSQIQHPWAWVRQTAGRALIRHLVDNRETPADGVASPLLAGPDAIAELEARYTVLRLLKGLPFRQRQVLSLTLYGLAPKEIADELDLTPEAVRASLKKARRRTAELLREEEHDCAE